MGTYLIMLSMAVRTEDNEELTDDILDKDRLVMERVIEELLGFGIEDMKSGND